MYAGIYIHIPFCKSKCLYCDFYSIVADNSKHNQFVKALVQEITLQSKTAWGELSYDTIYIGGGTPSLLGAGNLGSILKAIRENFDLAQSSEITVETNPESVTIQFLDKLLAFGVNRVSIGVQSFDDNELNTLGRIHDRHTAIKAISAIKNAGFTNWSLDLIFAIPGQTVKSWENTLITAVELNPSHISAYGLTIEKGTTLEQLVNSGKIALVDEAVQTEMYKVLFKIMIRNDYARYEISNFARAGYQSRHNLKYWQDCPYLGFGPAAHSYNGEKRLANVKSVDKYIETLVNGCLPVDFYEELTAVQKGEERLMMGIRLADGVPMEAVRQTINQQTLDRFIASGHVEIKNGNLRLTDKGVLVADEVIVELLNN